MAESGSWSFRLKQLNLVMQKLRPPQFELHAQVVFFIFFLFKLIDKKICLFKIFIRF